MTFCFPWPSHVHCLWRILILSSVRILSSVQILWNVWILWNVRILILWRIMILWRMKLLRFPSISNHPMTKIRLLPSPFLLFPFHWSLPLIPHRRTGNSTPSTLPAFRRCFHRPPPPFLSPCRLLYPSWKTCCCFSWMIFWTIYHFEYDYSHSHSHSHPSDDVNGTNRGRCSASVPQHCVSHRDLWWWYCCCCCCCFYSSATRRRVRAVVAGR